MRAILISGRHRGGLGVNIEAPHMPPTPGAKFQFFVSPSWPILINYRLENTRIVTRIAESGLGLQNEFT